jgi:hypothetical protein
VFVYIRVYPCANKIEHRFSQIFVEVDF